MVGVQHVDLETTVSELEILFETSPALTADPAAVRAGNRPAGRPTPMPT